MAQHALPGKTKNMSLSKLWARLQSSEGRVARIKERAKEVSDLVVGDLAALGGGAAAGFAEGYFGEQAMTYQGVPLIPVLAVALQVGAVAGKVGAKAEAVGVDVGKGALGYYGGTVAKSQGQKMASGS